jgi:hypothetical protein
MTGLIVGLVLVALIVLAIFLSNNTKEGRMK